MVDFVALVTPPKLLGPTGKPANGDIYVRSTSSITLDGGIVAPFQEHGKIIDGEFKDLDLTPLMLVVTPEGVALDVYVELIQDGPGGRRDKHRIVRTVSTPNTSTVTWDALVDVIPVVPGTEYDVPTWVTQLLTDAALAAGPAIDAKVAAEDAATRAESAAASVPTEAELTATVAAQIEPLEEAIGGKADVATVTPKLDKTEAAATYARRGIFENFTESSFRTFRSALARQRAGGAVCRVSVYGDSNSNGFQQPSGADYSRSYGERARAIVDGVWGPARRGLIPPFIEQGGGSTGGAFEITDPHFALGAGWSKSSAAGQSFNGRIPVEGTAPTAGDLTFTAEGVNSFTVWFPKYAGSASAVSIGIDDEAPTVVNMVSATKSESSVTVTTSTVGTHTLKIRVTSFEGGAARAYIHAIEAFNSAVKGLRFTLVGVSGAQPTAWSGTNGEPWSPDKFAYGPTGANPDLLVFNLMINSHNAAVAASTYKTQVEAVILRARAQKADVSIMLVASAPGGNGAANTWGDYLKALRELAATYGCGLINMQDRWGAYAVANAAPHLLWNDPDHPTTAGYWDMGEALAEGLKLAAGRSA